METTYLVCAAVGGTLIVCQFLMTLFGLGGHDLVGDNHIDAGGHDASGDHHVGHGEESSWFLGLLTFRTISAGLAFFGLAGVIGLRADLEPIMTLGVAVAAGLCAVFLVGYIMKALVKLNMDGTVRIENAVGCPGTVYVSIPGGTNGEGKVHISLMSRTMEYKAIAKDALPAGAKIVVVAIVGSDTVEVVRSQA